jgi:putative flippase GtrA
VQSDIQERRVPTGEDEIDVVTTDDDRGIAHRIRALLADERIAFVIMGGFNTAFAFAVFASLQITLGDHVHYLIILLITHVLGVLEAFTVYRYRVFKVKGNLLVDLARFESVNLVALAINVAMLPLLVEVAHLPVILAQVVVLCVVTLGTFLAHKHFSFRRREAAA